jgi:hypothetical protein
MIARIINHFYDNRTTLPDILNPDLIIAIEESNLIDSQPRTKKGAPSKSRESNKAAITAFLTGVDQNNPTSSPVKFDNLTFNAFASFLKTFNKRITKRTATHTADDTTVIASTTVTIRLSAGSFSNACSALSHLFTECGIDKATSDTSRDLWRKLALYLKGCRRTGARERAEHGLRNTEGKDPMPLAAYVHLAQILSQSSNPEYIVCHLFLEYGVLCRECGECTH